MRKITRHYKRLRITYIKAAMFVILAAAFFLPSYVKFEKTGDNWFTVKINGTTVGVMGDTERLEEYIREVRKGIAQESEELVFMDVKVETEGKEVLWGKIDPEEQILENIDKAIPVSKKADSFRANA